MGQIRELLGEGLYGSAPQLDQNYRPLTVTEGGDYVDQHGNVVPDEQAAAASANRYRVPGFFERILAPQVAREETLGNNAAKIADYNQQILHETAIEEARRNQPYLPTGLTNSAEEQYAKFGNNHVSDSQAVPEIKAKAAIATGYLPSIGATDTSTQKTLSDIGNTTATFNQGRLPTLQATTTQLDKNALEEANMTPAELALKRRQTEGEASTLDQKIANTVAELKRLGYDTDTALHIARVRNSMLPQQEETARNIIGKDLFSSRRMEAPSSLYDIGLHGDSASLQREPMAVTPAMMKLAGIDSMTGKPGQTTTLSSGRTVNVMPSESLQESSAPTDRPPINDTFRGAGASGDWSDGSKATVNDKGAIVGDKEVDNLVEAMNREHAQHGNSQVYLRMHQQLEQLHNDKIVKLQELKQALSRTNPNSRQGANIRQAIAQLQ